MLLEIPDDKRTPSHFRIKRRSWAPFPSKVFSTLVKLGHHTEDILKHLFTSWINMCCPKGVTNGTIGEVSLSDYVNESILSRIISLLSFRERVKVERVSQAWRKASLAVNAKKQTSLSIVGSKVNKNFNQNFCSYPQHRIYKLSDIIERTGSLTDMTPIFRKVPGLKSLHLKADELEPILTTEEAAAIPTLLPELEHLSIIDDKIGGNIYDDALDIIYNLKNLIHLEVSTDIIWVSKTELTATPFRSQLKFPLREGTSKTQMLQENLILKEALTITKNVLEVFSTNVPVSLTNCKLISNTCSKLRKLSVIGSSISATGLKALMCNGTCRGKYLRTFNITVDSDEQLQTITSSMLCLKSFYCVIDVPDVYDIACIGQLKNLQNLFLSCWTKNVLDAGLVRVFIGCKELTSLIINGEVSDSSFELLSNFCCYLRRIEINNGDGSKIADRTMYGIQKLDYLDSLSIYACDASDAAVTSFFENQSMNSGFNYFRIKRSKTLTKGVFPPIIEFASRKQGRFTVILPDRLQKFWPQYLEYHVPKNLIMKFEG